LVLLPGFLDDFLRQGIEFRVGALDVTAVSTQKKMNMNNSTATPTVSIDPSLTGFPSDTGLKATTITKP